MPKPREQVCAWARTRYPWHAAVWENDVKRLTELASDPNPPRPGERGRVDELDLRGYAPLHLAIMLNRQECLRILLERADPDCRIKSRDGWSPLAEALSLANVDLIRYVYLKRIQQSRRLMQEQLPSVFAQLHKLPDFQLEMHWEFRSWIPFVSNLCPSDTNLIYKRGASVRLDTTIAGFDKMKWIRGNRSFLMLGPKEDAGLQLSAMSVSQLKAYLEERGFSYQDCIEKSDLIGKARRVAAAERSQREATVGKLLFLNHQNQKYYTLTDDPDNFEEFEHMLELMQSQPKTSTELNRTNFQCKRLKTGVWGWRSDRVDDIAGYPASVWEVSGVQVISKVRTEHLLGSGDVGGDGATAENAAELSEENVNWEEEARKMEEALRDNMQMEGQVPEHDFGHGSQQRSGMLPPPPPTTVIPEQYFDLDTGPIGPLGRPQRVKTKTKSFKGKLWMTDQFPISLKDMLPVIKTLERSSVVFSKLVEFLSLDLPDGFPIQLEVPVLPILNVLVTFRKYDSISPDASKFEIPMSYTAAHTSAGGRIE